MVQRLTRFTLAHARDLLAVGSLAGLGVGFWMAWSPLGFIVPSAIVLGLLVWGHVRGGPSPVKPPEPPENQPPPTPGE